VRLYLAGPLFTQAERRWLRELAEALRASGHRVFLPAEQDGEPFDAARIFETNRRGIEESEALVAVLDGPDADAGTAWECGYAAARGRPFVAVRTDFRGGGDDSGLNLMLRRSAGALVERSALDERLEPLVEAIDAALSDLR
jgi:nucleoside 2-deoxyribosyltransferase